MPSNGRPKALDRVTVGVPVKVIVNFDDDDIYGPAYINSMVRQLQRTSLVTEPSTTPTHTPPSPNGSFNKSAALISNSRALIMRTPTKANCGNSQMSTKRGLTNGYLDQLLALFGVTGVWVGVVLDCMNWSNPGEGRDFVGKIWRPESSLNKVSGVVVHRLCPSLKPRGKNSR